MHEEDCDHTLTDKPNTVVKNTLKVVEFVTATSPRIILFYSSQLRELLKKLIPRITF